MRLAQATLVAPVLEADATSRPVYLPRGRWMARGKVYAGPSWLVDYAVAIDEVALFTLHS